MNIRCLKQRFTYAVAGALFSACSPLFAVEKSTSEAGQVVIVPVFSTQNDLVTLFSLTNIFSSHAKAVKLRLRDRNGAMIDSYNVYLRGYDTWTMTLAAGSESGSTVSFQDGSCALHGAAGAVEVASGTTAIAEQIGSIEVIESGVLPFDGSTVSGLAVAGSLCDYLKGYWLSGPWSSDPSEELLAPQGYLRAATSIINVEKGTLYSIPGVALSAFSDVVQHTAPADELPNLSSAHDAGTEAGATSARVCAEGSCVTEAFASPLDAVSAALMSHELVGEFLASPGIGAKNEFVINYPTRSLYPEESVFHRADVATYVGSRSGIDTSYGGCIGPLPGRQTDFCAARTFGFAHEASIEAISFNDDVADMGSILPSPILGIPHIVSFSAGQDLVPTEGVASVGFDTYRTPENQLTAASGSRYLGRAAIGVSLVEVTNATLQDVEGLPQRANYAGTAELSGIVQKKTATLEFESPR